MTEEQKTVLVISAHAADFVWRAGGAIALYVGRAYPTASAANPNGCGKCPG